MQHSTPPSAARRQFIPSGPRAVPRLLPDDGEGATRGGSASEIRRETDNSTLDLDWSRTLAALGGDAARKRLHALHPARPGDEGAATGFALAVLGLWTGARHKERAPPRPILWVQDRAARAESGRPYGLGLSAFGLQPAQLVLVSTKCALDLLAAVEMGLEIGALEGVLAELPPSLPADMLALGKRLALRAERSSTPCLLLHASQHAVPAPVATRWEIASAPAIPSDLWGPSQSAANLTLVKNRFGPTGRWSVPLSSSSQGAFDVRVARSKPPLPQPMAAHLADRSPATMPRAIQAA